MFPYLRKNSDYLNDCKNPEESANRLADLVNHSNWKDGYDVSDNEILSWINSTFTEMNKVLEHCDPNLCIGIEYFTEREDAGRVDMMIGGYGRDGNMKILVIELKQWDLVENNKENLTLCTPCRKEGKKYVPIYSTLKEKPALTIKDYIDSVKKHNKETIDLIPVIYAHNMNPKNDQIDLSNGGKVRVYYKDRRQDFINYINDTLVSGRSADENRDVFRKLRSGYESITNDDLAELFIDEEIVDGTTKNYNKLVSYLRPDQKYVLKELINHMGSGKRHVDVVYGGPGSGKTLIALLARRKLRIDNKGRETQTCFIVHEGAAPVNRLKKDIEENNAKPIRFAYVGDLKPDEVPHHLIFDEFHRLNSKNQQAFMDVFKRIKGTVILLIDERQKVMDNDSGADILKGILAKEKSVMKYQLRSQFRCGCDDGYVSWIEYKFSMGNANPVKLSELDFKPKIIKDQKEFGKELKSIKNKKDQLFLINTKDALTTISGYGFDETLQAIGGKHGLIEEADGCAGEWFDVHGIEFKSVLVFIGEDLNMDNLNDADMEITKNRYRMLLTRGMKSCKIFCHDKRLRDHLLNDDPQE